MCVSQAPFGTRIFNHHHRVRAVGNRRAGEHFNAGSRPHRLQGRFTGLKYVRFELGVRNVFDRAPPVSTQNANFQVGYDPQYGDPRGRMYYGTVRVSFK